MGLSTDTSGNLYAAAYGDRAVRRITPSGEVTTVATVPMMWGPTGVAVALDGAIWVLEASVTNAQRVRRVDPSGRVRVF
jgi:sugar lactone lactonase YvrE